MAKRADSPLPRGPTHPGVAEDQDARPPGVRDRGLDEGPGPPDGCVRRVGARRPRRGHRRAPLGRQRRHRVHRRRDRPPARPAATARARAVAVFGGAEDAARAQGRCHMGRARARRGGRVRRVDARRPPSRAVLSGPPRGQASRGRRARDARPACGDPQGRASAQALQPRQAVLARGGDHEGRPARVLPRHRACARASPPRAALHDAALSGRRGRQVVLPEGRAEAHARLDPDRSLPGLDPGATARSGSGSTSRS